MRPQSNGLTTAEWYLMESLWEHSPKTGREIIEDMKLRRNWNRSTTLTMLRRMTDEQEAFFAEKQIQLDDYYDLNSWYHGGFMDHTDEELIEALETCYRSKLALSLGWEYPG